MNILRIFRNKYLIVILSIFTLGLFSVAWMIYLGIKLKTLRILSYKPATAISITFGIALLIIKAWGMFILLLFVTHWFLIPKYLGEERELIGLKAKISWKIGLLPTLASFYTFGFIFILSPPRGLSESSAIAICIPMLVLANFTIFIWMMLVHEKYVEFHDKKQAILAERVDNSQERRKRGCPLPEMLEPYHKNEFDDLPMLELPKIEEKKENQQENNESADNS